MGYVLLWLEALACCVLFTASVVAFAARLSSRRRCRWLALLGALAPTIALAGLAALVVWLQLGLRITDRWLVPEVALTLATAAGSAWIVRAGLRPAGPEARVPASAEWPAGRLAAGFGMALAVGLATLWNIDLGVRLQLTSMRGEVGTMALSAAPVRVPDSENAAILYQRAFEELGTRGEGRGLEGWQERWDAWIGKEKANFDAKDPELRGCLARNAPGLELLRRAAAKPACWFPHDYSTPWRGMLIPEVADSRPAAQLLAVSARARAADGDLAGALQDINATLRLGERIADESLLVALVRGIAVHGLGLETLSDVLAVHSATAEDLRGVELDESYSFHRILVRAMRMEEAFGLNVFASLDGSLDPTVLGLETPCAFVDLWTPYRVFLLADDLRLYRQVLDRHASLASQPYHLAKARWEEEWARYEGGPRGLFTGLLVPALGNVARRVAEAEALCGSGRCLLALHRFRASKGRFPERIEDLVPDTIPQIPTDPFDGGRLRMRRTEGEIVVYSVGPDGMDDGGVNLGTHAEPKGDLGLRVAVLGRS